MELNIDYSDIKTRCKLLSSYEAQSAKSASGDTIYQDVIITDKEDKYIEAHLHEAVRMIESRISSTLDVVMDADDTNSKVVISVDDGFGKDKSTSIWNAFTKSLAETIVSWILGQWFAGKLSDRANAYLSLYENMLEAAKRTVWKRKRPTMNEN